MVVPLPIKSDPYINVGVAFACVQTVAVLGRMYVRGYLIRAFGKDDVACICTLVVALAYGLCLVALWRISNLQPISDLPPSNVIPSVRLVFASLLTYILATMLLKVSLGLLLLRVLAKRSMVLAIYATMGVSVVYGTGYFFLVLFECGNPLNFPYDILQHNCLSAPTVNGVAYTHAAITSVADVILAALPVIYLWNAELERRVKFSVGGILVLGSVGCICSFVRIGWVSNLTTATNTFLITSRGIALMSALELAIGLTCISLATYKPLFKRYFKRGSYAYGSESVKSAPSQTFDLIANGKRDKYSLGYSNNASNFNEAPNGIPTTTRDSKSLSASSDTTTATYTTSGKEPLSPRSFSHKPANFNTEEV